MEKDMEKKLKILAVQDPAVFGYVPMQAEMEKAAGMPVQLDIVPWAEYYPTMLQIFSGQAEYDIFMVAGHLWLRDFVEKGYLQELHYDMQAILPRVAEEMKYQGKTYLSPSFCDGHLVVYRKSMVGKELPEMLTAKEYMDLAKELAQRGLPIAMKAHASEILTDALPFLRMTGAGIYGDAGEFVWEGAAAEEGLQAYCRLKQYALPQTETYGNEEIADAIRQKKVPLTITWSGQMGAVVNRDCIEPEDLGYAALQTGWNVTWSFAVSAQSRNKETAEKVLAFLRSPKADAVAGSYSGAPICKQSYTGKEISPWYPVQLKMIEKAQPFPPVSNSGEKNGILYEEIFRAFTGQISPQTAVEHANSRMKALRTQ